MTTNAIKIPLPDCDLEYATLYTPEYVGDAQFVYQGKGLISYLDRDNHVGLMNTRGEIVISAENGWDRVEVEEEADVVRVRKEDYIILYDLQGKPLPGFDLDALLKSPKGIPVLDTDQQLIWLDALDPFSDGLALGKKDGRFYYVNTKGRVMIKCKENSEYTFHEFHCGMAMINTKWKLLAGKKFGYINKSGKIIISPKYSAAKPFSNGFAAVFDNSGWHYIDAQGKKLEHETPFDFYKKWSVFRPEPFGKEHVAAYLHPMYAKNAIGQYCILHKSGLLLPIECRGLIAAGDDRFITCNKNATSAAPKYGLRDILGILLTEERYDAVYPVKEGSFLVSENEKWGLVDEDGKILVPLEWDRIYPAGEIQGEYRGLKKDHALVAVKGDKFGLMDFQGNVILPPVYDHTPFYNGKLTLIIDKGRGILLNRKQQNVLPDDIHVETILMHGLLLVKQDGKTFFLDYGCDI